MLIGEILYSKNYVFVIFLPVYFLILYFLFNIFIIAYFLAD